MTSREPVENNPYAIAVVDRSVIVGHVRACANWHVSL